MIKKWINNVNEFKRKLKLTPKEDIKGILWLIIDRKNVACVKGIKKQIVNDMYLNQVVKTHT